MQRVRDVAGVGFKGPIGTRGKPTQGKMRPSLSPSTSNDKYSFSASVRSARPPLSPSGPNERFSANAAARNPLSLRLYKSLASNFQDSASREALETLSALYATDTPRLAPRRTSKNDDETSSSDEEELPETGAQQSGFSKSFTQFAPLGDASIAERARKNSRRDVEQQLISSSVRFLHAFGAVNQVC